MLKKIITFSAHKDYVDNIDPEDFPVPIKTNIPEWFKKLNHSHGLQTVKGCMPFLDTLTTGYLLKFPQDYRINHNDFNKEINKKDSFAHAAKIDGNYLFSRQINLTNDPVANVHNTVQLEGSPHLKKNKNLPFYKILNPWTIKTPPGYSCLFLSPMNNQDDRFDIIPGIVDTDVFTHEVNFPIVINGDKYENLKAHFKKGTPLVQVIPFKRDSWEMKIKKYKTEDVIGNKMMYFLELLHKYKNKFWHKKTWT
jgi:hypothetical protein